MSLELALETAVRGWPVFPAYLTDGGAKRPHLRGWQAEATTLGPVLREWWERWPDSLVAVPTGSRTGLYVVDVDSLDARPVARALLGKTRPPVVPTRRADGVHLLFHLVEGDEHCRTVNGKLHPKLDVKGEGGYVVAWQVLPRPEALPPLPSAVARATRRRTWVRGPDDPPTGPVPIDAACVGVRYAREGERNQVLNRWAWATAPQVLAGLLPEREWREKLIAASVSTGYPHEEAEEVLRCVLEARRERR